jgi:hypothetical protein
MLSIGNALPCDRGSGWIGPGSIGLHYQPSLAMISCLSVILLRLHRRSFFGAVPRMRGCCRAFCFDCAVLKGQDGFECEALADSGEGFAPEEIRRELLQSYRKRLLHYDLSTWNLLRRTSEATNCSLASLLCSSSFHQKIGLLQSFVATWSFG